MPATWEEALLSYRYPVTLADFMDAQQYPGWFCFELGEGDRTHTTEFETQFRESAPEALEPWLEVVFWKLYSQPAHRNRTTRRVAVHFQVTGISPKSLWQACLAYIETPTKTTFESFRQLFGFHAQAIAVAATFPAFVDPAAIPMV